LDFAGFKDQNNHSRFVGGNNCTVQVARMSGGASGAHVSERASARHCDKDESIKLARSETRTH